MSSPVPDELIAILLTLNAHPSPTDDIKKVLQDLKNQKKQPDWPSALANLGNLLFDPFRTDYLANLKIVQTNPDKKSNLTITQEERDILSGIIPCAVPRTSKLQEEQSANQEEQNEEGNVMAVIDVIDTIITKGEGDQEKTALALEIIRKIKGLFSTNSSSKND